MKYRLELPLRLPRLRIQVWDQNVTSADTLIGEATLDLAAYAPPRLPPFPSCGGVALLGRCLCCCAKGKGANAGHHGSVCVWKWGKNPTSAASPKRLPQYPVTFSVGRFLADAVRKRKSRRWRRDWIDLTLPTLTDLQVPPSSVGGGRWFDAIGLVVDEALQE